MLVSTANERPPIVTSLSPSERKVTIIMMIYYSTTAPTTQQIFRVFTRRTSPSVLIT